MEIPIQYLAVTELGLLGRVTGNANRRTPRPKGGTLGPTNNPTSTQDDENKACQIYLANEKDMAFGCGHLVSRVALFKKHFDVWIQKSRP
ncbi:hypothetical protein QVD17_13578 [Tagetes erecta]|uniref:Uncharacterized protein n=1 Tax=Tagetes erecta TaxID=13708 RepID=A0AAD8P3G9_TARER|nr:hypothetical protein QVD17_13578 [Tagetes erecta]